MKQQHILFIFRSLGTGGSQKVQAFVANSCVKRGYKVTILSMSKEKCSIDIDNRINIVTLDYDKVNNTRGNRIKYLVNRMKYVVEFRRKCIKIDPDLVCSFLIDIVRLTVIALRFTKYPILGSERADPSQFEENKIKKYNSSLNKCTAVVFQLEEASKLYKLNPNVISEVIPNPAMIRNIKEVIEKKDTEELFVFGAGRLSKQKRFDVLIDAYNEVKKIHPEYHLKIYGDGEELEFLKSKVSLLNLEDSVVFKGNVKNIFQDVNNKSIFVLTSDFEGIPNVITEALINKIPCISTDCSPGGARLLLDNGLGGDVVERENYKKISESIIKYIENPDYSQKKVDYGYKHIKKFNPQVIEERWMNLIERIIE